MTTTGDYWVTGDTDRPLAMSETARPPPTSMPAPVSASPPSCRSPTSTVGRSDSRPPRV